MTLWYLRVLELVSDFTQDLGEKWRMLLCGLSTWWLYVVKSSQCIGGYIDPAKLLGEKERGNVKCLFSLFWEERREEKAVDCILVPASLAHQNQESSAWLLMRGKMDRCHTQGIVGRTDLKTKQKNKKKLQKAKKRKFHLVPNSGDFTHTKAPLANANLVIGHVITLFSPINEGCSCKKSEST